MNYTAHFVVWVCTLHIEDSSARKPSADYNIHIYSNNGVFAYLCAPNTTFGQLKNMPYFSIVENTNIFCSSCSFSRRRSIGLRIQNKINCERARGLNFFVCIFVNNWIGYCCCTWLCYSMCVDAFFPSFSLFLWPSKIFDSLFVNVCSCVCFFRSLTALSMMLNFEFLSRAPNIGEKAGICILQFKWTGKTGFAPIQPRYGFLWDLSMFLLGDHEYTVREREGGREQILRLREKHLHMCYGVSWYLVACSVYASRTKTNNSIFFSKKNSIRRNRVYVVLLSFISCIVCVPHTQKKFFTMLRHIHELVVHLRFPVFLFIASFMLLLFCFWLIERIFGF